MTISTIFKHNHSQIICLPDDVCFPDSVKKVEVRVAGLERIIAPAESTWDSFFLDTMTVTDDFMAECSCQSLMEHEN